MGRRIPLGLAHDPCQWRGQPGQLFSRRERRSVGAADGRCVGSYGSSGGGVFEARGGGLIGLVEGYRTARVVSHGTAGEWYIDVPVPGQTFVTSLADIRRFLAETGNARLMDWQPSHSGAEGLRAGPRPARLP